MDTISWKWHEEIENELLGKANKSNSKNLFKKIIKTKIRKNALINLNILKGKHSKVKDIEYENLSMQAYLSDKRFSSKEKQLLFKLRTKMIDVKGNFKNMYPGHLKLSSKPGSPSPVSKTYI